MALSDSGCSGDEGYFLYWAGRSYEAGGESQKAYLAYRRILERFPEQKSPSTGRPYGLQALAQGLVLAAVEGNSAEVERFLRTGDSLLGENLDVFDDNGQLLASAPGGALGHYCLARALVEEGSLQAAAKLLREGTPPAEGTFLEGGQLRSLTKAWLELIRFLPENG